MASLALGAGGAEAGAAGHAGCPRGRGAGDEPGPGMASARPPGWACASAPAPAGLRVGPPVLPAAAAPEPAGSAEAEERSLQRMLRAIAEERGRLSLRREVCGLGECGRRGGGAGPGCARLPCLRVSVPCVSVCLCPCACLRGALRVVSPPAPQVPAPGHPVPLCLRPGCGSPERLPALLPVALSISRVIGVSFGSSSSFRGAARPLPAPGSPLGASGPPQGVWALDSGSPPAHHCRAGTPRALADLPADTEATSRLPEPLSCSCLALCCNRGPVGLWSPDPPPPARQREQGLRPLGVRFCSQEGPGHGRAGRGVPRVVGKSLGLTAGVGGVSGLAGVRSSVPMDPEEQPRGVGFAIFCGKTPPFSMRE